MVSCLRLRHLTTPTMAATHSMIPNAVPIERATALPNTTADAITHHTPPLRRDLRGRRRAAVRHGNIVRSVLGLQGDTSSAPAATAHDGSKVGEMTDWSDTSMEDLVKMTEGMATISGGRTRDARAFSASSEMTRRLALEIANTGTALALLRGELANASEESSELSRTTVDLTTEKLRLTASIRTWTCAMVALAAASVVAAIVSIVIATGR